MIGDVNSSAAFFSTIGTIGTIPSSPGALVGFSDVSSVHYLSVIDFYIT